MTHINFTEILFRLQSWYVINLPVFRDIIGAFNNREKSIAIWLLIFLIWLFWQKNIRKSILEIFKNLFHPKLFLVLLALSSYIVGAIFLLSKIKLWEPALVKDVLFWFFGFAFITFLNLTQFSQQEDYFKKLLIDNLKFIVFVEFITNLYAFSLWLELILVPIIFIIAAMDSLANIKEEYASIRKTLDYILSGIGFMLIIFALFQIIHTYPEFVTAHNVRSFLLAPILTIIFTPFLYLLALYTTYENLFVRVNRFLEQDRDLVRFTKWKIFQLCHLNLKKLYKFNRESGIKLLNINNKKDVLDMLANLK